MARNHVQLSGTVDGLFYRHSTTDASEALFSLIIPVWSQTVKREWVQRDDQIPVQWWRPASAPEIANGDTVDLWGKLIRHDGDLIVRARRVDITGKGDGK